MSFKTQTYKISLGLVLAACFSSGIATAQQSGARRGPPPEAIEACAGQSEQAACSFTGRRGEATGQCMAAPQNQDTLACMPAGGPPKHNNN